MEIARQQLYERASVLSELAFFWEESAPRRLWWDRYRRILVAIDAGGTYRKLYGKWGAFREWYGVRHALGKVRRAFSPFRWIGPAEIDIPLPPDVVVMDRREGLLVALTGPERNLKIHSEPRKIYECRNEIEA